MAVRGLGAKAEGGTFGPGTVGRPEGTLVTVLRAREAEKGGRAGTAQWALAPQTRTGHRRPGPAKTPGALRGGRVGSRPCSFGTSHAGTAPSVSKRWGR